MTAPDLTRTRATQCETQAAILDEPVHFVEKLRDLLDLVDNNEPDLRRGLELLPQ